VDGAGARLDDEAQVTFFVFSSETQLFEVAPEDRRVIGHRHHQIAEIVGVALRVLKDHRVVDDQGERIGDAQAGEGALDAVDDRGGLQFDADLIGS
jgi:hypothetical protein